MSVTKSFGQANSCTDVYSKPEIKPIYDNDYKGLSDYLIKELVPIIGNCIDRDKEIIASLYIVLTIDKNGKVIDAIFPNDNLTKICKGDLKRKLLTMSGWTAGRQKGKPVCSKFDWQIACLRWE